MGAPISFPQLPGPAPQQVPGPFQGYNNPSQGTAPAPANTGANLLQGVTSLVQQFQVQKEHQRQHDAAQAQQSIQNMMLGLPVDVKKTAQLMKKAGMNIDFDTPLQTPATPPQDGSTSSTAPGGPTIPNQAPGSGMPAGPPPNPTMPQTIWDKIKAATGVTPPSVNPQSPGIAALQRLQQMGQTTMSQAQTQQKIDSGKQQLELSGQGVEAQQQALIQAGLGGNDKAWETLRQLQGKPTSMDQIFQVGRKAGLGDDQIGKAVINKELGLSVTLEQQMQMAKDYSKYFGNDMSKAMKYVTDVMTTGKSDLQPANMSLDERIKIADTANDMQKTYPTAPHSIVQSYANALGIGNTEAANKLAGVLDQFPTEDKIRHTEWSQGNALDIQKFHEQTAEYNRTMDLDLMKTVRSAMGTQFDEAMRIIDSKQSTSQEIESAKKIIADASNKLGKVTINGINLSPGLTTDTFRHWSSLLSGSTELTVTDPGKVDAALGAPDYITDPKDRASWSQVMQKKAEELLGAKNKDIEDKRKKISEGLKVGPGPTLPQMPPMTPGAGPFAAGPATMGPQ